MNTNEYIICRKCGKKLENGTLHCTECGTPVDYNQPSKTNLCTVLSWIVLFFGIVGSFFSAYTSGIKVSFQDDELKFSSERDVVSTIVIFALEMLVPLILYSILATLGEIKWRLRMITPSQNKTTKPTPTNNVVNADETWHCPECGQKHPMYVGVCQCGTQRTVKADNRR